MIHDSFCIIRLVILLLFQLFPIVRLIADLHHFSNLYAYTFYFLLYKIIFRSFLSFVHFHFIYIEKKGNCNYKYLSD